MGHELLVAKLVKREMIARISDTVKVFNIGDDTCVDLHVNLFCPGFGLYALLVLVFKSQSFDATSWYYFCAEVKVDAGYECRA